MVLLQSQIYYILDKVSVQTFEDLTINIFVRYRLEKWNLYEYVSPEMLFYAMTIFLNFVNSGQCKILKTAWFKCQVVVTEGGGGISLCYLIQREESMMDRY